MVGIYFSGTGNTKHCVEHFLHLMNEQANAYALESKEAVSSIQNDDFIVLGYSVQYSNAPMMVRDFIHNNKELWQGKKVFVIATMGLFSGDGTGCSARILKKYGANVVGGLHLCMPDSISDCKALKKTPEQDKAIVKKAEEKIVAAVLKIKAGTYPKEGLGFFYHMAGLFGQRLWFYGKTRGYSNQLKVSESCTGCGVCAQGCPMKNLAIKDGKVQIGNQCTMCYKCVNSCPNKALTLLGKKIQKQYMYKGN